MHASDEIEENNQLGTYQLAERLLQYSYRQLHLNQLKVYINNIKMHSFNVLDIRHAGHKAIGGLLC